MPATGSTRPKPTRKLIHIASAVAFGALACSVPAQADQAQNQTISATAAHLTAAGFGNVNGNGITIGLADGGDPNFAGSKTPNSLLPNGNANLPAANFVVVSSTPNIQNHASEVSGVLVSTIPNQLGMTPKATIASGNLGDLVANGMIAAGANSNYGSPNMLALFQRPGTPVVNMSFGLNGSNSNSGQVFSNNGKTLLSPFVDWAIQNYNVVAVVAGNQGGSTAGSPSDAFNTINVVGSGTRNGNTINYNVADYQALNVSDTTSDGRIKADICAPAGDPGFPFNFVPNSVGSFTNLPTFADLFQTTAGGQFNYLGQVGGNSAYTNDAFLGNSTAGTGIAVDTAAPKVVNDPFGAPPATNPGNLQGADTVELNATLDPGGAGNQVTNATLGGTSFAAPLVSGAVAMLYQQFKIQSNSNAAYLNHLAAEALLLNGGSKTNIDSISKTGRYTPWTRADAVAGQRTITTPSGKATSMIQPGLDPFLGTGQLNVINSLNNLVAGQQGPGPVNPTGWDLQTVPADSANGGSFKPQDVNPADNPLNGNTKQYAYGYDLTGIAGQFQATLTWDMPVTTNGAGGVWSPGAAGGAASSSLTDGTLANLDLDLFNINAGTYTLAAFSSSNVDNVEHIYVPNLALGNYELDVVDVNNPQATPYGLAWSVPEPSSLCLIAILAPCLAVRRRVMS
jgi:hypothetical protein